MSRSFTALYLLGVSICLQAQGGPEPILLSYDRPQYPVLARAARIQGEVRVSFKIKDSGETSEIELISGHPILAATATSAVRSFRFAVPGGFDGQSGETYTSLFAFVLEGETRRMRDTAALTKIETSSFRSFRITTPLISEIQETGCPEPGAVNLPATRRPDDFVEMGRSGCYGACPQYVVRIYRDGRIEWDGFGYVHSRGPRKRTVGPGDIEELFTLFETEEFWSLCADYSQSVTDSAAVGLTVEIGGRTKSVSNYADSAPPAFGELEWAVDEAADTHRWRHGDPSTEALSNIGTDAWMAKPGITNLMRAAGQGRARDVASLIRGGEADVSAIDASGWTALMYAASAWEYGGVAALLQAGADPNHVSLAGDTPLLVGTRYGSLNQELVEAGADVNHQNALGVSPLMAIASAGDSEEIREALKAGAIASLRDVQGRTALDYLTSSDCGKSPLRNELNEFMTVEYTDCGELDRGEFRKSKRLLTRAMHKERHE